MSSPFDPAPSVLERERTPAFTSANRSQSFERSERIDTFDRSKPDDRRSFNDELRQRDDAQPNDSSSARSKESNDRGVEDSQSRSSEPKSSNEFDAQQSDRPLADESSLDADQAGLEAISAALLATPNLLTETNEPVVSINGQIQGEDGSGANIDLLAVPSGLLAAATDETLSDTQAAQTALTTGTDGKSLNTAAGDLATKTATLNPSNGTTPTTPGTNEASAAGGSAGTIGIDEPGLTTNQNAGQENGSQSNTNQQGPSQQLQGAQSQEASETPTDKEGPLFTQASVTKTGGELQEAISGLKPVSGPQAASATTNSSLTASTATTTTSDANPMDKAVGNQIQRALVERLPGGERVLTLRLTPPELGTVRIEVVERQGTLLVKLGAEDDSVKASLERVLPQLRAEMRAHDAPISSIDLTDTFLSDRDAQGQHSSQGQNATAQMTIIFLT